MKKNRRKKIANLLFPKRKKKPTSFSLSPVRKLYRPVKMGTKKKQAADIHSNLKDNLDRIKKTFHHPTNSDIVIREFSIGLKEPVDAFIVYIDGMADGARVDGKVLQPLMLLCKLRSDTEGQDLVEIIQEQLLPSGQTKILDSFAEVVDLVLRGMTALFVDGKPQAIVIDIKGFKTRGVEKPQTEQVVQGPHEGFNEVLRTNTSLLRRKIHSPDLVMESAVVGEITRTDIVICYIKGVCNPKLIEEVKYRISSLETDFVVQSGLLEQLIEDTPNSLLPTILTTELPDRTAAFLAEGHAVVLVDNSPFCLVMPSTFTGYFHSPEDMYLRWPYGAFIRLIRVLAIFIAIFAPAIYVAIANYHQEMLPTDLALAIAASREAISVPIPLEVLIMEAAFELIREAGIRIPSVIGPTIGIVGALLIGDAAVSASLISPILVIIVAMTAIASFAIPNYSAVQFVRIVRFVFIFLASIAGIYGISLGLFILAVHMVNIKSFGVPFMAPIAPYYSGNPDIVVRGPLWRMERRPRFLRGLKERKQAKVVRNWTKRTGSGQIEDKEGSQDEE